MNKQTLVKILAVGLGIAAAFGAGGCDNGNSDPVCECPNGTVHVTDDNTTACCDGTDCTCTREQKTWALDCGISLDNQSNASIAANVSKIEGAIGSVNAHLINEMKSKSGAKIIVETGDYGNYKQEGNAVKISIALTSNQSQLSEILKNAFLAIAGVENEYYLDYNVKVVNETGEQFRDGLIDDITAALGNLDTPDYVNAGLLMSDVSARYPEVIIDGEPTNRVIDGDTVRLGQNGPPTSTAARAGLAGAFYNMLKETDPKAVSVNKESPEQAPGY